MWRDQEVRESGLVNNDRWLSGGAEEFKANARARPRMNADRAINSSGMEMEITWPGVSGPPIEAGVGTGALARVLARPDTAGHDEAES